MPQQRRQQWLQQQQNDMRPLTPVRSFMASADDVHGAHFSWFALIARRIV